MPFSIGVVVTREPISKVPLSRVLAYGFPIGPQWPALLKTLNLPPLK
jgi:hypothetical protein